MQCSSGAHSELLRWHIVGILRRVISEAEERLAHLRCCRFANGSVPAVNVAQPVEPVIERTIERQDFQPFSN